MQNVKKILKAIEQVLIDCVTNRLATTSIEWIG
jgi:hypothetical protein